MACHRLDKKVCLITVGNPGAFNALSSEIIAGLVTDFAGVCAEKDVRVIIFRGEEVPGKRLAPLAGADLSQLVRIDGGEYSAVSADLARQHMEEGIHAIKKIRKLCRRHGVMTEAGDWAGRVFVLGMVDGPCLAGGIEFMFGLSDIVIATPRSVFGMREIGLGGMGGWRGPQTLREILCAPTWVKEMLLGLGEEKGGDISAENALARGLVNRLVKPEEIEDAAMTLAQRVANLDPLAVTFNLEAVDYPLDQDCTPAVTGWMVQLMMRPSWVGGVKNFFEGRKK